MIPDCVIAGGQSAFAFGLAASLVLPDFLLRPAFRARTNLVDVGRGIGISKFVLICIPWRSFNDGFRGSTSVSS
jgi:hypothetical protein